MPARTRAQAKKAKAEEQERNLLEAQENSVKLRNGRMIAKVGTSRFIQDSRKRKRKMDFVLNAGNEGNLRKRVKPNNVASTKKSTTIVKTSIVVSPTSVTNPLPSLRSLVSYTTSEFNTATPSFQKSHRSFLNRLRRSETSIPQHSILESDLLNNRFYCTYAASKPSSLPTLGAENAIEGPHVDIEAEWTDHHVIACRVVPLLGQPLSRMFLPEFFRLQPVEEQALTAISELTLENLEFDDMVKLNKQNPFKKMFDDVESILWGSTLNEKDARRLFQNISKPIFEVNLVEANVPSILRFEWFRGRVDDSIPLAGKRVGISRYHDIILAAANASDPLVDNPVSVANFYFQTNELLRAPAIYAKSYQRWNSLQDDVRDNRKYPHKYSGSNPPIPSRTPTPPPIPTQSEYLETQKIPSTACYATELKLMLAQIAANVKQYGLGDHEAVLVGMTNLRMHFSVAFFPADHIRNAMEKSVLPTESLVYFLQSEEYDLATVDGRRGALTGVIALTKFLLSGKAKIGRLQKFFSDYAVPHSESTS